MKISVNGFGGMMPRLAANLLPNEAAQIALNVRLKSGTLRPYNLPKLESTEIVAAAKSVFMLGAAGVAMPLSWESDVDVAPSPLADDEYRVYYTGDGLPKKTSYALANFGAATHPAAWYLLGVPAPTATPTLAATTGSVASGTYAYVYTCVTQFGSVLLEESQPSPAQLITLASMGGVTVSGLTSPPTTNRNYVYKRIYRSSGGEFQLVAQIPFANTSYTDSLAAASIPGDVLATTDWAPPPDDLKGVVTLPSQGMVGYRGKEVWFSEPGFPHAWPAKYMQTVDSKIVALKAFGNNIAIGTEAHPYVGSGLHPDSFTLQKMPFLEPCVSKRSMASDERGAMYVSPNGLISLGGDMSGKVSDAALSREQMSDYGIETMVATVYDGRYYGFYNSVAAGAGCLVFSRDPSAPVARMDLSASAVTVDQRTARMLFVDTVDARLYRFDSTDTLPMTMTWKTKEFRANAPHNLGCFRIVGPEISADDQAYNTYVELVNVTIAANNQALLTASSDVSGQVNAMAVNAIAGVNGSLLQAPLPQIRTSVNVTIFGGKTPIAQGEYNMNVVHRLPAGMRYMTMEALVSGQREVLGIEMASSPQELRNG